MSQLTNLLNSTKSEISKLKESEATGKYPDQLHRNVAKLAENTSAPLLANKLGISKTFIYNAVKKFNAPKKKSSKQSSETNAKEDIFKFLDISPEVESTKKSENSNEKPFMKVVTPNGSIIEIWG